MEAHIDTPSTRGELAVAGMATRRRGGSLADVVIPDAPGWWRVTRAALLAVGPLACLVALAAQAAEIGAHSATIGAAVICAAWSPLAPVGMHALLCVDERAEMLRWAPGVLREMFAWPAMLVAGRARAETWASTLGVAVAVTYWAAVVGW